MKKKVALQARGELYLFAAAHHDFTRSVVNPMTVAMERPTGPKITDSRGPA
jgi:hypothetical protein